MQNWQSSPAILNTNLSPLGPKWFQRCRRKEAHAHSLHRSVLTGSPTPPHQLELSDSQTLARKETGESLATCSQVFLCFPKITRKGEEQENGCGWAWMSGPAVGGMTAARTRQWGALGVLGGSSDPQAQTGRTPGACQGLDADRIPSFPSLNVVLMRGSWHSPLPVLSTVLAG